MNVIKSKSSSTDKFYSLLIIAFPGVWMLLMNSIYNKWNYGGFILLGSIILFSISSGRSIYKNIEFPFRFLYISMLIWSVYQFANWVTTDTVNVQIFLLLYDTWVFRFLINLALFSFIGYSLIWLIKYIALLKSKYLLLYILVHSFFLVVTLSLVYSEVSKGNCTGIHLTVMYMPCVIGENYLFMILAGIVLLFLPTVLTIYYRENEIYSASVVLFSIIPLWMEIFFYPFQGASSSLLLLGQSDSSIFVIVSDIINASGFTIITFFMILFPLALLFIKPHRLLTFSLAITSILVLFFVFKLHFGFLFLLEMPVINVKYFFLLFGILILNPQIALMFAMFANFQDTKLKLIR